MSRRPATMLTRIIAGTEEQHEVSCDISRSCTLYVRGVRVGIGSVIAVDEPFGAAAGSARTGGRLLQQRRASARESHEGERRSESERRSVEGRRSALASQQVTRECG